MQEFLVSRWLSSTWWLRDSGFSVLCCHNFLGLQVLCLQLVEGKREWGEGMSTSAMPWLRSSMWRCLSYFVGENSPYFPDQRQRGHGKYSPWWVYTWWKGISATWEIYGILGTGSANVIYWDAFWMLHRHVREVPNMDIIVPSFLLSSWAWFQLFQLPPPHTHTRGTCSFLPQDISPTPPCPSSDPLSIPSGTKVKGIFQEAFPGPTNPGCLSIKAKQDFIYWGLRAHRKALLLIKWEFHILKFTC